MTKARAPGRGPPRFSFAEILVYTDPEDERIDVYRLDPRAGAYRHVATYRRGDRVTTPLLPGLVIDVAVIFG